MRVLLLLATLVLLAACVHDKDDFTLFVAEEGASLTYYLGGAAGAKLREGPWELIKNSYRAGTVIIRKSCDCPWDSFEGVFPEGSYGATNGRGGEYDDPWDTIFETFGVDGVHVQKSGEEDPWDTINVSFGGKSVQSGSDEVKQRRFMGVEKSRLVFLSFSYEQPTTDRARVVEVRGRVSKLVFLDGTVQYVVGAPDSWKEGTEVESQFYRATTKKARPFLGVRVWRTVPQGNWVAVEADAEYQELVAWPREFTGASLLARLPGERKSHADPWDRIQELFPAINGDGRKSWDDPWDTIRDKFDVESVHVGKKKGEEEQDDLWDRILVSYRQKNTHTGKKKSFRGHTPSKMLLVSLGEPAVFQDRELELVEIRGRVGRLVSVEAGDERDVLFVIGVPEDWELGLKLEAESYLLDDPVGKPLAGAMVWRIIPNLG